MGVSEAPTESTAKNIATKLENVGEEITAATGIPTWGLVAIVIGNCNEIFKIVPKVQ